VSREAKETLRKLNPVQLLSHKLALATTLFCSPFSCRPTKKSWLLMMQATGQFGSALKCTSPATRPSGKANGDQLVSIQKKALLCFSNQKVVEAGYCSSSLHRNEGVHTRQILM